MNADELSTLLKTHPETRNVFVGVAARDTLPKKPRRRRPCAYICNTAKAHPHLGEHWVCFYFKKKAPPEYFDSNGMSPQFASFQRFLGGYWKENRLMLQSPLSTVCGQYCMFYILMRNKGYTMEEIQSWFSPYDLLKNDQNVNRTVNALFNTQQEVHDATFLQPWIFRHLLATNNQ